MLSLLAAAVLALSPLVTAAPTANMNDAANSLAPAHICVKLCVDIHYAGHCTNMCASTAICNPLTDPLRGQVSSIQPAEDASGCNFYEGGLCDGEALAGITGQTQLIDDLTQSGWNDRISSYICY